MELRHLKYFAEVARLLSFSKASRTLHVSQPALSKTIRLLEEELGVVLFERSTRQIRLTDDGETLLAYSATVISTMDDLASVLHEGKQLTGGTIRLGLPPVIGASLFPSVIAGFSRAYPKVRIELVEEGGKLVEQSVLDAAIDLGVVVLPVDESIFGVLPLAERKQSLIVNVNHPLAGRERVRLSELREETFISFKKGFSLYDRLLDACRAEGFEPRIAYESSQWDFIAELVAEGLGIAFLPETACEKADKRSIVVIPRVEPAVLWNLGLIWSKKRYLSHAARGWIRYLEDRIAGESREDFAERRRND